jgi:hypothetical protein
VSSLASIPEADFADWRMLDYVPGLVAIVSPSGRIEHVNRGALEYFGRTLEELQRWQWGDAVHPGDLPSLIVEWEQALGTGKPPEREHRLRRADGVYRWFQLRGLPLHAGSDGQVHWCCLLSDIHDRKTAEEKLLRSETFMLEVQRLSHTGGWRYDFATDTVEGSPEVLRAHAVQPGEDPSKPAFWFGRIHPDDVARVNAEFTRCMNERAHYRAGFRNVLPDGTITYQYTTGNPIVNDAGELVEFVGASMDMTEHWLATTALERASQALRELQIKMSRAAQIAAVAELAASIAHEVNQPLAGVVANAHACSLWLSADPPNLLKAKRAADRIVRDGKDASEVVRRVRSLFKRTSPEKVLLDVSDIIREVLRVIDAYPARKQVTIEARLEPDLPPLRGDRVQLQQLVLNLVLNALEALEGVDGREKLLSVHSNRVDGERVGIRVVDNGGGIDDMEAVFDAFFTTKAEGMGMGLSICRSIAVAHGGVLTAERNDGFGMTFTVTLPIEKGAAQEKELDA